MSLHKIRLIGCCGLLLGGTWAGVSATFTDSGTAESTFSTGTIDLELADEADDAYDFTTFTVSNMKPGQTPTYAALKVENAGTLGLTYTMATSGTNTDSKNLRDQLQLGIRKVAATCNQANFDAASGGDIMYATGALSSGAIASRALASVTNEIACFKIDLPSGTADSFQNATTTATFTFSATQS